MRLLVDHGSVNNIGDTSMLEGVLRALVGRLPHTTFHVIDRRQNLKTEAWAWPRVVRQRPYRLARPLRYAGHGPARRALVTNVSRVGKRILRRGTSRWGFSLQLPGWLAHPADLVLADASAGRTLDEYCRAFDAVHIVGGGFLTDTFDWGLIQRCALIRTFAAQGKPVVLTGQQVGPFAGLHSRAVAANALRSVAYLSVREPTASLAICRRAGLRGVTVTGDDSFGVPADVAWAHRALAARGLSPAGFFAVNVRLGFYVPEHEQHLERIDALVRRLAECTGMPGLVVPIAIGGQTSDIDAGYRLRDAVGADVQVLDDPALTPCMAKGIMSLAHGAVGISHHFCTFALSQGIPAVCIHDGAYYRQKAEGLAAFWEEPGLNMPLPGLDVEAGTRQVLSVWRDAAVRQTLAARAASAVETWRSAIERGVIPALQPAPRRPADHDALSPGRSDGQS